MCLLIVVIKSIAFVTSILIQQFFNPSLFVESSFSKISCFLWIYNTIQFVYYPEQSAVNISSKNIFFVYQNLSSFQHVFVFFRKVSTTKFLLKNVSSKRLFFYLVHLLLWTIELICLKKFQHVPDINLILLHLYRRSTKDYFLYNKTTDVHVHIKIFFGNNKLCL